MSSTELIPHVRESFQNTYQFHRCYPHILMCSSIWTGQSDQYMFHYSSRVLKHIHSHLQYKIVQWLDWKSHQLDNTGSCSHFLIFLFFKIILYDVKTWEKLDFLIIYYDVKAWEEIEHWDLTLPVGTGRDNVEVDEWTFMVLKFSWIFLSNRDMRIYCSSTYDV